jgi:hypothetical protein
MTWRITLDPSGQVADGHAEVQMFGTPTLDLPALSDWQARRGSTYVAMESTCEY